MKNCLILFITSILIWSCTSEQFDQSKAPPSSCSDIDVLITSISIEDGCCLYGVSIEYDDQQTNPTGTITAQYYIDGVFIGGSSSAVAIRFQVEVCDEPKILEVYSDGELCVTKVLECQKQNCCSLIDYTVTSTGSGNCCTYTLTFNNPTGCENPNIAYQWYGVIGVTDTEYGENSLSVTVCGKQRVRFHVLENLQQWPPCYSTQYYTSNGCLD